MKKKSDSWVPRWLRHRALLTAETVLLVGIIQKLLLLWVLSLEVPNEVKVIFVMATTVGIIGLLLIVVQVPIERSLEKTHQVAKFLRIPLAVFIIHLAILAALYYLYAFVWELPVWPYYGFKEY